MADNAPGEGMSKSAKKRAAKKARDEAFAENNVEEAPAPPPPPAPKAKGKAKAAPAPEPEPKAKAKGKGKAAPEPPAQPKAEPKAKGKAKAKAEPEPTPPPPPPAPKAKGKAKAKAKAAPVPEEEPVVEKKNDELINYVMDDGTGGAWEVCSGLSKKAERSKKKAEEAKKAELMPTNIKRVPGAEFADEKPTGKKDVSQAAAAEVKRILASKAEEEGKPAGPALTSISMTIPEPRIGVVIGPKGANITMLQNELNVKIDTAGGVFTITGTADDVARAQGAVNDLITKGYTALQYEGFTENIMNIHPSAFPDLIGKQGCVVQAIKKALGVELKFDDVPPKSAPGKKGKVTLAGKTENVEQAKQVINDILMYQHHDITHPGETHETVDVEPWAYRYIIGKAGSELKHIQHNWKVRVCIPREHSTFEQVLIIGPPDAVSRAKTYIEKLIWNAENNAKGRDRTDNTAADPWGEEEEEEPWMKQYMYKR
mmetsp:Transcript_3743/g.5132  ORF Transcript_3743/g.5132 Transcript_3743/m.5132 type:complete len:484 (+) Transcript_3743:88-1539(+)|eukprot:CAMPEP_0194751718 /NCGR_PEP_ID=MMETSP0323_2-20130528/5679_1 /TAXON_ID=2866 ORGANISM="Crypthecodinium cohnii, Strain Seligo" /NCGR_SAMPLE_ID=MMETSP0323_2 /ASSEMBLY_ACC=CAM_ASM_000346 /LENGTH=483 /DNA_ID=CAMNT_0039668313 /DNA_START=87 /DNA_END=1538 /DNA_ORIENTATION=+